MQVWETTLKSQKIDNSMARNHLNINKQFMVGNGILAFAVFAVICIFLYMSFRFQRKVDKLQTFDGDYAIELSRDFAGEHLALYLNDSLLLQRTLPDSTLTLHIHRFAEENVLMVVNVQTDRATSFNLSPDGGRVKVGKQGNEICVEESR